MHCSPGIKPTQLFLCTHLHMPKLQICLRHTSRLLINRVLCVFPHAFQRMQSLGRLSHRSPTSTKTFASISFSYFFRWLSLTFSQWSYNSFPQFFFDTVCCRHRLFGASLLQPHRLFGCEDHEIQKSALEKHFWLSFIATFQLSSFVCHLLLFKYI